MKSKIRWFNNKDVFGYIEHKKNGDIIICYSHKDKLDEYTRLELVEKEGMYELNKED